VHNSKFVNEEINAVVNQASRTVDPAARYKLYPEIAQRQIDLAAPQFAVCQMQADYAIDKNIVGWNYFYHFQTTYIDYQPWLDQQGKAPYDPTKP